MIKLEMGRSLDSKVSYDDARLYIFTLGNGWRLPTHNEWILYSLFDAFWFADRATNLKFFVQPVREVNDA